MSVSPTEYTAALYNRAHMTLRDTAHTTLWDTACTMWSKSSIQL